MHEMDIFSLVQEFYAMEAVLAMLMENQNNGFEPMRHSHSRWYSDFTAFRDEFVKRFAAAIYDYTILAVAAELRHCKGHASRYIAGYYSKSRSREDVYIDCTWYAPRDILLAGIKMFDTGVVSWADKFGGEKWKQIANAGLLKGKIGDCAFVDHCVDLSHNNSVYFDKGAGIFYLRYAKEYKKFLDLKRICEPETLLAEKQGAIFDRLLLRARNLSIIKVPVPETVIERPRDEAEASLLDYQPLEWGNRRLDFSDDNIIIHVNFNPNIDRDTIHRRYSDRQRRRQYRSHYDERRDIIPLCA